MESLVPLLADIVRRHGISPANVIGHSDVAPARKTDPGELFDWDMLARYRLALARPRPRMRLIYDNDGAFFLALERLGYDISDGPAAIRAFERRWRPHRITGEIDGQIGALLFELLIARDLGQDC
jgi:N-acetylmuramoyl-L-alanine amidase